jgi:hypothetical protein
MGKISKWKYYQKCVIPTGTKSGFGPRSWELSEVLASCGLVLPLQPLQPRLPFVSPSSSSEAGVSSSWGQGGRGGGDGGGRVSEA